MAKTTYKHLTKEQVIARLKHGFKFMEPFVGVDRENSRRFLDPSVIPTYLAMDDESDGPQINDAAVQDVVPIGPSNVLTAGILAKIAAISVNRPDWHVVCQKIVEDEQGNSTVQNDPESADVVRQHMRDEWNRKNWQRTAQRALLKRSVGGLGCVAYSYPGASEGSVFETVHPSDLAIDPFVLDWQNPKYAGRKIRMSLQEASERYPDADFKNRLNPKSNDKGDLTKVTVEIYWDKGSECHVWDNKVIIHRDLKANADPKRNLYGAVPLLFLEGDLHPGKTPYPLGDGTLAAGAAAEHSDITQSISETAKAGTGFTIYDSAQIDNSMMEAIKKGKTDISVKGADENNKPIFRIPGEELRTAVLEAKRESRDGVMSMIGVSQMDLGQMLDSPSFATEVAAVANKGGARQNIARAEYENFLNRWAAIHVTLVKNFGGPYIHPETGEQMATEEQKILHEAYKTVVDIKVVEASTTYKDPGIEQQQSMQLYQQIVQSYEVLLALAQMGLMTRLPNLEKITDRMLRAFGISNTDQMWMPAPQMPQQTEDNGDAAKIEVERMKEEHDTEKQIREHLHESTLKYKEFTHEENLKRMEISQRARETAAQLQQQRATAKSRTNGSNGSKK